MSQQQYDLNQKRKEWLYDNRNTDQPLFYYSKFEKFIATIENRFPQKGLKIIQSLYDIDFFRRNEIAIYELIDKEKLSIRERYYLLISNWLFYSGYAGLTNSTLESKPRYDTSIIPIISKDGFSFSRAEVKIIDQICINADYRKVNHTDLYYTDTAQTRNRLIATCLILAETFQESFQFEEKTEKSTLFHDLFSQIIPKESEDFNEIYFHFLKKNVFIPIEDSRSTNERSTPNTFYLKNVFPDDGDRRENLKALLQNYFRIKLSKIKNVLESYCGTNNPSTDWLNELSLFKPNRVNIFADKVEILFNNDYNIENDYFKIIELISNIITHQKGSALALAEDFVSVFEYIINQIEDRSHAVDLIERFNSTVFLKFINGFRPCHVILNKLHKFIQQASKDNLSLVKEALENFTSQREDIQIKISQNAYPILAPLNTILVFGYSNTVIQALGKSIQGSSAPNKKIYIVNNEGKDRYNHLDELEYHDGTIFYERLKKEGFEDLEIIPFISIGNIFKHRNLDAVILGANGFNVENQELGNSAGFDVIMDIAQQKKVPAYILIDSWKVGGFTGNPDLKRKSKPIPEKNLSLILNNLSNFRGMTRPLDDNTILITEQGIFPHNVVSKIVPSDFNLSVSS